jgi:putative transposase
VKKSRFTEAQIVSILKDWNAGAAVAELARKHGVHANTLRLWRSKYGGLEVSEEESARMRRIIATQALEIDAMKELIERTGGVFTS